MVITMKMAGLVLLVIGFFSFVGAFGCLIIQSGMFNVTVSNDIVWLVFISFIIITIITVPLGIILLFIDKYKKRKKIVDTFTKIKDKPVVLTPKVSIAPKTTKTIVSSDRGVKSKAKPVKKVKVKQRSKSKMSVKKRKSSKQTTKRRTKTKKR